MQYCECLWASFIVIMLCALQMLWVLPALVTCTVSMTRGQILSCLPPNAASPASECSRQSAAVVVIVLSGGGGGSSLYLFLSVDGFCFAARVV